MKHIEIFIDLSSGSIYLDFNTRCQRFGIAVFIWIGIVASTIIAIGIPAVPADSFVESIGVNTHWAYTNVYTHNYTGLKAKLAESGIRYIRDRTHQVVYTRANDLYASLGIKTIMLTGRYKPGQWPSPLDPTQVDEELNEIKTQALAATVALEAPNEYDHSHGPDTDWVGSIKNYSTLLYTEAKADPLLRDLPVIGPSLTTLEAYEAVGNADSYIDYGNQHLYQWTFWPGFDGMDKNGSRSITWYLDDLARCQSPSGKRIQGTEAGYTNYIETGGLSEEADGKYMARIFAEFFRRGVYRTYKYELVDEEDQRGREGMFGLLRSNLTEKSSFRAVINLISLLSDKGPSFKPDTLNYTLNGSMENVRQILFQKRNGDFYLMIWLEVSSWDVSAKIDLYPPPQEVALTLQASNNISGATLYAFNNTADVNIGNLTIINNQVTFNVTDKISMIKLINSAYTISSGVYRLTPKSASHPCEPWIVEPISNGFYRFTNRASGRILKPYGCNINNENITELNNRLASGCEQWKLELLFDGHYRIKSEHIRNQCLDVQQCSSSDNTESHQQYSSNSDCQPWKLEWIAPIL